jgi:hypothetical protein
MPGSAATPAVASIPRNLIEDVIHRLFELRGISVQKLLAN